MALKKPGKMFEGGPIPMQGQKLGEQTPRATTTVHKQKLEEQHYDAWTTTRDTIAVVISFEWVVAFKKARDKK